MLLDAWAGLQEWREAPLILAMPKSADTSITNLSVANLVRPSVFATAVVSNDDAKKAGVQGIRDGEGEPPAAPHPPPRTPTPTPPCCMSLRRPSPRCMCFRRLSLC
jgi:hypothetical protein